MDRTGRFLRRDQLGSADRRCGSYVEGVHRLNAVCGCLAHCDFCDGSEICGPVTHRSKESLIKLHLSDSLVEQGLRKNLQSQKRACGKLSVGVVQDLHRTGGLDISASGGGDQHAGIHERQLHDPSRHPPRRRATSFSISSQPRGVMPDRAISARNSRRRRPSGVLASAAV